MEVVQICNGIELCAKYLPTVIMVIATLFGVTGALVYLATVLVRIPSLNKYEGNVGKIKTWWLKISRWLPTIGVNPQTKKLEEAIENKPETPVP